MLSPLPLAGEGRVRAVGVMRFIERLRRNGEPKASLTLTLSRTRERG
jgi:hypothetical protein